MSHIATLAREDRAERGIAMMLAAYLAFALVDTSVKWLLVAGLPALQLAFMRYAGHLILSGAQIARGGTARGRWAIPAPGLVLARAVLLLGSTTFNFIALQYLPLSVTGTIMFSAPILVSVLAMPMLGERVGPWRWGAIVVGFAGVVIVMRPFGAEFHPAMLLSLAVAACMALYSILTRKLAGVVAPETQQFYIGVTGAVFLLPFAWAQWVPPSSPFEWTLMIGIGVAAWAGHEVLTRAHRYAAASTLMPYTYSFLLYLILGGYLVFGDVPDAMTLAGAALIVMGGLVIWWRESRRGTP